MRILLLTAFLLLALCGNNFASSFILPRDTTINDTSLKANDFNLGRDSIFTDIGRNTLNQSPGSLSTFPAVSLQQFLKGNAPGVYVQEPSGEPGTVQNMHIRGLAMPLLSNRELYQTQPLIVVDGIPLISNEHPFSFDIQQFDFNRIGTATNLLTSVDMNNIESIEVLKDMAGMAIYGPMAANGVIVLTTKKPAKERRISFNTYFGGVQRPNVTTINGDYENSFRKQFYDRYTTNGRYNADDSYPVYLADSLNASYYGPSDWTDSYYQNGFIHAVSADISGGSERANFRFSVGNLSNKGIADDTGLDRYSAMFSINMKPLKWLLFSAMVNGNRIERDRNRNLRDRFSQMNYIPDLSAPLAPNNSVYSQYLNQFENSFDDNATNIIQGHAKLVFDFDRLKVISRLAVDYNEGYRDLFYPRPLLEENSYVSNYYGFNQRMIFDNTVTYDWDINARNKVFFEGSGILQWDTHKYNYAYAYKGINDFIKLNLLESDPYNGNYLNPTAFPKELVYRFLDRTQQNLVSFYGRGSYNLDEKYTLSLLLRVDGSSNAQPTSQWLFTPTLSLGWDIKKDLMETNTTWSGLNLRASAGRLGRLNAYDNFSEGPQYTAEISYTGNKTNPGYNSFAILSRPYDFGWVGYGIPWAYTDQLNIGLDASWLNNRFRASVDAYIKQDKNQLIGIPSFAEFGYSQSFESGMDVSNAGVELMLGADIFQLANNGFGWTSTLSFNYNKNELTALPNGLDELVIGNRKLKVGESVDRYWLYTNKGMYQADSDVPVNNGMPLSYNGTTLHAGDPVWADLNGDNLIDNSDKSLMGNIFPKVAGGFNNDFSYQNWTLGVNMYFNLGRELLNQEMANRFDFINREGTINMNSVKEITFWEKRGDYSKYPIYNPWSTVIPYRAEQDLFLENASFLKVRTLSLGYDLSTWIKSKSQTIQRLYVYGSANNLLTITPYTGRDPELVNYTGFDSGYGMQIPRTYTIGLKMDL
jgi:TonB-linked SusC/RagA family outer membrane protein